MVNSFFRNGDKAYSENLNDSILVGNAFDWTVSIGLPADNGGVFPNSSSVVKGKVADCSITPNSNLSIGSTISNSSGSGQVYRLTVYPNFNRFGGFKSISLTADSGVTFYIANKGGTSPIASNLDYSDLSNVPELKVLKEYDIVITIPSNKEVTGLSFVFQSSSASVSGSISQSNVNGLDSRLDTIEDTAVVELVSSTYNATIDTDFTITAKVTDLLGNNVVGKSVILNHNGTSVSSKTTNSNGEATWTITPTEWGTHDFEVLDVHCQVRVGGWKQINTYLSDRVVLYSDGRNGYIKVDGTFSWDTGAGIHDLVTIDNNYLPKNNATTNYDPSSRTYMPVYMYSNGALAINKAQTSSGSVTIICTLYYPLATPQY